MRAVRAAVAAAITWAALASPAHATGVVPCAPDEVGSTVVVRDVVVSVCVSARADCPPDAFGSVLYLNGARLAAACLPDPGPLPPIDPFALAEPVVCSLLIQLRPGVPGVVDVTYEGDVYVLGEFFWDCPPYAS